MEIAELNHARTESREISGGMEALSTFPSSATIRCVQFGGVLEAIRDRMAFNFESCPIVHFSIEATFNIDKFIKISF
jgi:hypothetical protein